MGEEDIGGARGGWNENPRYFRCCFLTHFPICWKAATFGAIVFLSPGARDKMSFEFLLYTIRQQLIKKKREKSCYERGWPWLCVAFVRRERGTGAQTQQHTHMLLQQCDVANFGRGRGIRRRLGLLSAHSTLYALFSLSLSPLIKKAPPGGGNSEL